MVTRLLRGFLAAIPPILVLAGPSFASSSPAEGDQTVSDRFARATAFYAEHEELRTPPSSGWKHFVRGKRFLEARTVNGAFPTAADRARAWEAGRARRPSASPVTVGWFSLGPANIAGRILDLKFHPTNPEVVYAGSASGGLWISSNGGDTWRTTTDALPSLAIGAICVVPTNPSVVLAATGDGLTWMYAFSGAGIWRSADGGRPGVRRI